MEHQEESVAHNHEPRRSGRIHARGDIAHPSIVLAKWLLSEFMVVKPSEACIVSMLKRACKASGGHAMVRVLDGGMMIWCVNMHPRLIFTLIPTMSCTNLILRLPPYLVTSGRYNFHQCPDFLLLQLTGLWDADDQFSV